MFKKGRYCVSAKALCQKVKVKVRSQKVTVKEKPQTFRAAHVFWVILHVDIEGDRY